MEGLQLDQSTPTAGVIGSRGPNSKPDGNERYYVPDTHCGNLRQIRSKSAFMIWNLSSFLDYIKP